ncbi:DUF6640 family protein [Cellulomonas hominis]|uniref:DUF6640 family protein n=1 Tax=Cellulomonas hominis TaxID=156981 RepID=UPI001B98015B|nr:DUF6640 family protein [Cellulomonas hominis]VTR75393.1 hypothetical protein CHMI_00137 [Cellulomonas hominis]
MRPRTLLGAVGAATAVSGFAADWNRTHLFNPAWPPHARFHDAQTITTAAFLGSAAVAVLRHPDPRAATVSAGLTGAFWASVAASFLYPGTGGLGAERPDLIPHVGRFPVDERVAAGAMLALTAAGWVRARRGRG